ncbi:MAG: hypothetical protein JXD18_07550 [Anaerolineae bacterium]|nr:hypothetical protein [Anaerolineae bacterium]
MKDITAWVAHGFSQRGVELNRRILWALVALLVLIGLLGATRLLIVSHVVAAARDLQDMRLELNQLQQDNAALELDIARIQSADALMQRAQEMNLQPAERVVFVNR